jgi:hypothetical protein
MRRFALLCIALAAAASPLAAQTPAPAAAATHPDFSGKWTLDAAASGAPAGAAATLTITQDAKGLKIDQVATSMMGTQNVNLAYAFDGPSKNTVNAPMGAVEMNSTVWWDGPALMMKTNASVQGQTLDKTDKWVLSADGKTLTITSDLNMAGQSMQQKQVLTKS